jgi:hypothetical protein
MNPTKQYVAVFLLLACVLCSVTATASAPAISDELKLAVSSMDQELKSPFAKVRLERIVLTVFRARVDLAPKGYERDPEFQKNFERSFSIFRTRLWNGEYENAGRLMDVKMSGEVASAYARNEKDWESFLSAATAKSDFLRGLPPGLVRRSQIYFSLILLSESKDEWEQARKFTFIFPFC